MKKKIFISYSHKDETWKDRLAAHLKVLEKEGYFTVWDDSNIDFGESWFSKIEQALNEARVAILMISVDFLISGFIREEEVPRILARHREQGVRVIPLILKPCAWEAVDWLSGLQAAPKGGKPLSTKEDHEIDTDLAILTKRIASYMGPGDKPVPGTPRQALAPPKVSTYKMPTTGEYFLGREKELKELAGAWADEHTHIVALTAWGGVGKTALVNRWLNEMEKNNYRGARRVYAWSFYSQGAGEGKQASADEFMQETLGWFGDNDPTAGSAVEKGRRLVQWLRQEKTLFILDGLEPQQYPPGQHHGLDGKLKDQGLRALLRELASGFTGLCIITSREKLTDLADKKNYTVKELELEHLSHEAGAELLRSLGVKGRDQEILKAVGEYDGHALALTLLGQYLKNSYQGDIRRRDRIPRLSDERLQGGHARRVMAAYETWFGESAEKELLYIMGLFDRPVEMAAIEALKTGPAVPGVTGQLGQMSEAAWNGVIENLRSARLLAGENPRRRDVLDSHPLVRQHFGERLRENNPEGWRESHRRLYHYYKDLPEKELPDTLAEMEPLFAAVCHGCRAGLYREALDDVYSKRIRRRKEAYTVKKLGAFGADLAALANFFAVPWSQPAAELPDREKAVILSWAAFGLRALGRLREGLQPMKATLELYENMQDSKEIAIAASNLSELLLTLGEVREAVEYGSLSVTHADRGGDAFWKEASRTTHADALHQWGQLEPAGALFREAEEMQRERQPQFPFLYSLPGFRFCDLLLGRAAYQEVRERAEKFFEWRQPSDSLLDISLDNLTAGRAWMMAAEDENETEGTRDFTRAAAYLDRAVEGLREAGTEHMLPLGLLARAACSRLQGLFPRARADLREAREIAEQGEMKLHLVDYHLEAGRLCLAENQPLDAQNHFQTAAAMIQETGYHRRDKELEMVIGH